MTEVEKRRLKLLQDTRRTYSEPYGLPAVHPRYKSVYNSLYKENEERGSNSTFTLRLVISILIFALFCMMNYQNQSLGSIDSQSVLQEIQREYLFR